MSLTMGPFVSWLRFCTRWAPTKVSISPLQMAQNKIGFTWGEITYFVAHILVAKEFNQGRALVFFVGRICTLDPKLFQHVCCREGWDPNPEMMSFGTGVRTVDPPVVWFLLFFRNFDRSFHLKIMVESEKLEMYERCFQWEKFG